MRKWLKAQKLEIKWWWDEKLIKSRRITKSVSEFEVKLNWLSAHRRCFCPLATALVRYVFFFVCNNFHSLSSEWCLHGERAKKGKLKWAKNILNNFFPTTQFSNCEKECRSQQHSVDLRLDDLFTPHHQCCVQFNKEKLLDSMEGREKGACLRT